MPVVHANGIDLYYERQGHGPRLLFLNGSGATVAGTLPLLAGFAHRFDLLIHDQRGLGQTEIPEPPYSMADYAADALALLDAVGWDTARVIGLSFGGMVAQELAVTAPERVERLVLACTSPGGAGGASYPLHELAELAPAERARVYRRVMDTRFDDEWLAAHPGDRRLVEAMAGRQPERDPEHERGAQAQLQARRGHDVGDRLGAITCPTFVACGRTDGIAPLANGEFIASHVAGAELHVYDGGHAFMAQDPAAVPDMMAFLAAGPT